MAPRGRPRKRLSRMDAAVDAMTPFGFDELLVRKTVNKLLKEYEGDEGWEGWAFIEDSGYKELIDAILRDQEAKDDEEQQIQTQKQGVSSQDERAEDPASESTIAPSGALVVSTCNGADNTVGETACTELVNAAGEPTYEELCSNKQDIGRTEVFCPPPAERDGNRWTDIGEDQIFTQKGLANAVFSNGENPRSNSHVSSPSPTTSSCPVNRLKMSSVSQVKSRSNSHVSTPPPTSSSSPISSLPPPADRHTTTLPSSKPVSVPPRKRVPCYGWIGSDDEEDADDFIQLPPMKPTTPLQSQNSSGGTNKQMKRKSRWDIRPNDP
ncbi:uncharacterized protein LOC107796531 isoform X1 [Nicotiana tabacum]|uniref:Uncharacterized protein LOC107796531 isoform X1 n=1 Tax=Nicotiana tabacum TaxID=4097 RepID=A0A1S4ADP3_TOBAC|nr:uncharacterized protein LOC104103982 isoform X1 [Nicotiana tomentosiformis]XP_016474802.1 PREDICTED: uncharacterized protein LOC107796531 isoform X2 [Nicotiana tabacum]